MRVSEAVDGILTYIAENEVAFAAKASEALGYSIGTTYRTFQALLVAGVITIINGDKKPRAYALTGAECDFAKPLPAITREKAKQAQENHVVAICRQNWSGYHIHKVFGSAQRAAVENARRPFEAF